jgi:hypothetical protein
MKKFVTTILAFIYLSTSMGATVHLHYCMGKLFSWSLIDRESKGCSQCKMPKGDMNGHSMAFKDDCCKEKYTHVQLDKDQKTTEAAYTLVQFPYAVLPGRFAMLPDVYVASYIAGHPTTNAPPEPDKVPLFIRNCHFRI